MGPVGIEGTGEQLERFGQMELIAGALAAVLALDPGKDDQPRGPEGGDGSGRGVFGYADAGGHVADSHGRHPALVGEVRAQSEVFQGHPGDVPATDA